MESKRRKMSFNPPDDLGQNLMKSQVPVKQLPCELLLLITKYLGDDDCVALALSGAIKGFAAFYRLNQKHVISNRCFYLTPTLWPVYFKQHIIPASVTSFNVNHIYWLPAELLANGIFQMKNLEELKVKDTQVKLPILADILKRPGSSKLVKLDFGFRFERDWKNLKDDLKKVILDSMAVRFKKLTCLKVSTCVHDARDYRHDPWQPILSFLRDCIDLGVEITYTGEDFNYPSTYPWVNPVIQFNDLSQFIRETIYPHLGWMKSLKSLVLIKLGPYVASVEGRSYVDSFMLNHLLAWLFSEERAPRSLQHFWIQDFCFQPGYQTLQYCASSLKTCQIGEYAEGKNFADFPNLEIIAQMQFSQECSLLHLPNLKYVYGLCYFQVDETDLNHFIRSHPKLEYLTVEYIEPEVILNQLWKLPNLKVLNYLRDSIDKEIIESLVKVYPNVEILYLYNRDNSNTIVEDQECLSSINFPNLTSLSLQSFKIHDGSFLLPIINKCPKLQRMNINRIPCLEPAFISNLDLFLPLAEKLRDVRLELTNFNGSLLLPLLKSFLTNSPQLERLVLLDGDCDESSSEWDRPDDLSEMADSIVNFALKMPRLVALCINFYHLDWLELNELVNRRIKEEVLPSKPYFWFYFTWKRRPLPSFPSVPFIHYHEMVMPSPPWAPPKIELLP